MTYVLLALGVGGAILFLLWRLEVAKRKRFQIQKEIGDQRIGTLQDLVQLERKLHGLSTIDQRAIRKEIRTLDEKLKKASVGEIVTDIFGTGGGE